MEQKLLTLPDYMSSPQRLMTFVLLDHKFFVWSFLFFFFYSFVLFSFGHWVVCPLIYGFWFPFLYLQVLLIYIDNWSRVLRVCLVLNTSNVCRMFGGWSVENMTVVVDYIWDVAMMLLYSSITTDPANIYFVLASCWVITF